MPGTQGKLNFHAKLTLSERVLFEGMSVVQAAYMANVSRTAGYRWVRRFVTDGTYGLRERSRRPLHSPGTTPAAIVDQVLALRRSSGRGPLHIAYQLQLACSTVYLVLKRAGLNRLRRLDKVTRAPVRYEHAHPGDLLHIGHQEALAGSAGRRAAVWTHA